MVVALRIDPCVQKGSMYGPVTGTLGKTSTRGGPELGSSVSE